MLLPWSYLLKIVWNVNKLAWGNSIAYINLHYYKGSQVPTCLASTLRGCHEGLAQVADPIAYTNTNTYTYTHNGIRTHTGLESS